MQVDAKVARKSQKNSYIFSHIQLTCVDLRTNLNSTKVNDGGRPNEMQVKRKSKTCIDLQVRLASPKFRILFIVFSVLIAWEIDGG